MSPPGPTIVGLGLGPTGSLSSTLAKGSPRVWNCIVYGYATSVTIDIPDLIDPTYKLKWKNPEWVMVFQELGDVGSRAGSGNVMVTTLGAGSPGWSVPINLTPDDNVHSNVTGVLGATGLHTIHLDGGPAALTQGQGCGGGILAGKKGFVVMDTPMEPDPAVVGCKLDFPTASPGSLVKATVEVENAGLVSTPVSTVDGSSAISLEMVLLGDDGRETIAARSELPELQPGQKIRVDVDVEMPLDPAILKARILPGPRDRDLSNNERGCWFGTPKPTELTYEVIVRSTFDENETETKELAVKLSWSSPVVYDEVMIYRDGAQVTTLPGQCSLWIDVDTHEGSHVYEVRGRILVSRSMKSACRVEVVEPVPGGIFRRGDVDGSGRAEITDAIALLGYLFLGSRAPRCHDAADSDDSGRLEITDAVKILNYLFSGGSAPPAPGPDNCGRDPTRDPLPECVGACAVARPAGRQALLNRAGAGGSELRSRRLREDSGMLDVIEEADWGELGGLSLLKPVSELS